MANFRSHITGGVLTSATLVTLNNDELSNSILATPLLVSFCIMGSVTPDLDADKGRPVEIVFRFIGLSLSVVFTLMTHGSLSPDVWFGSILMILFLSRFLLRPLFEKFTVHRGIFHSIPMALLMTSSLVLFFEGYTPRTNWLIGLYFCAGYVTHLVMDEIWSIDLIGLRVKRSFGTALKLSGKSASLTFVLYLVSGLFFGLAHHEVQF